MNGRRWHALHGSSMDERQASSKAAANRGEAVSGEVLGTLRIILYHHQQS
jgi:hypothetical protein